MPLRNAQLEDDPRRLSASPTDPTVQTGEGAWYTKDVSGTVEGFYKDDQGNAIQITSGGLILGANPVQASGPELTAGTETALRSFSPDDVRQMVITHSGGGGAVSSVNGETGVVVLTTDDISDAAQTNKWTTAADISKLAGIDAGAQVNATQASGPELTAGTETALRSFSPADVKSMIDTHAAGGGGVAEVYTIILPDAANLAARIALATVPAGWTLTSADLDAETQFGADSESLVIIWDAGLGTKLANISVYDNNTSTSVIGGVKITSTSQSNPSNIKVNSSLTKAVVQFTSLGGLPSGRDVLVQVALS